VQRPGLKTKTVMEERDLAVASALCADDSSHKLEAEKLHGERMR
jgi:hypothetical protein